MIPERVAIDRYEYGAATEAIRVILHAWRGIDWYAPPQGVHAERRASELIEDHIRRSRAHLPDGYAAAVRVEHERGAWPEFSSFCEQVAGSERWDWRFGLLKSLSAEQARAQGWSALEQARRDDAAGRPPETRFFVKLGEDLALWCLVERPTVALRGVLGEEHGSRASWYASYASADLTHAVAWHLADPGAPLRENPFDALLRCYAKGFYPFCVAKDRVVLFSFVPGERRRA